MKKIILILIIISLLTGCILANSDNNPVVFKDAKLEKVIREKIDKPKGKILKKDIQKITELDLSELQISSLQGVEQFSSLKKLNLSECGLKNISSLKKLKELERLDLVDNKIEDISSLKKLKKLKILYLYH